MKDCVPFFHLFPTFFIQILKVFGRHNHVVTEFNHYSTTLTTFSHYQATIMNFGCPWWICWHFQPSFENCQMVTEFFSAIWWRSILEEVFKGKWVFKCNFWFIFYHLFFHLDFMSSNDQTNNLTKTLETSYPTHHLVFIPPW